MKKVEWFWNLMFYNVYKFEEKIEVILEYLNPFIWIPKILGKQLSREKEDFKNNLLNDNDGTIGWAQFYIGSLVAIIMSTIFNLAFGKLIWKNILNNWLYAILYGIIIIVSSVFVNNHLLYNNKKYLQHFYEFNKANLKTKHQRILLNLLIIIGLLISFLFSFTVGYSKS